MADPSDEEIRADILHRLYRKRKWGGAHTPLAHLHKWCPQKYSGRYKDQAERLIKDGLVLSKPTGYGTEVSLNPKRGEEITGMVKKFFKDLLEVA